VAKIFQYEVEKLKADQILAKVRTMNWQDTMDWLKDTKNRERLDAAVAFKNKYRGV
jgi:hypothetical protein